MRLDFTPESRASRTQRACDSTAKEKEGLGLAARGRGRGRRKCASKTWCARVLRERGERPTWAADARTVLGSAVVLADKERHGCASDVNVQKQRVPDTERPGRAQSQSRLYADHHGARGGKTPAKTAGRAERASRQAAARAIASRPSKGHVAQLQHEKVRGCFDDVSRKAAGVWATRASRLS